jgi:hypothetical protein
MAQLGKKKNSINDSTAQQLRNNQNVTEILTKLDQSLHSNDSFVTLKTIDSTGKEMTSQFPTMGYFKQQLDRVVKTLGILSGIEGNPASIEIANNSFKRIITADLNLEPKKIDNLDPVSVFKTNPNWIFDSFLNPKISVELDLTNKVEARIRQIQTRRFIVEFDRQLTVDVTGNEVATLTTLGQARKDEFDLKYKGKSNIDLIEFVQYLKQQGVVNRVDDTLIDEDYFRIEPNRLNYKGLFSVLSTDVDTINKKLWYILDTLTYYDVSNESSLPAPVQLKVGDLVNVNPNVANVTSTTVYKVIEISTITSDLRVRFEQVYGEEPIPVRIDALNFYSEFVPSRKVRVSIGFDEHNVLFVRPFDDVNNLIGKDWSSGIGFYTNELKLDDNNGEAFSEYYVKQVYDYGLVIEDLVQKKVPNYYSIKPNAPVLEDKNFKVVHINQHLTNTVEAEQIRDLHNSKNDLTSQIQQLNNAVEGKNRFIETTVFESQADRKKAEDELGTLQNKLKTKNETKFTIVKNILASKKNVNQIAPKFKVRGFWPMPQAVTTGKTAPQEVVQFEVWYRYVNKSGAENPIATFADLANDALLTASSQNTTVNANLTKPKKVNAAFSNWKKYKTDARVRSQDLITGQWKWHIEDVQDANTPNINQLDLDISPGEVVQVKIKSLSEVGWPETPGESDFSTLLEIPFPEDLKSILNDDQFILKEASADDLRVNFEQDLEARGLGLHLGSSIRLDNIYYAHKAEAISSGFKDDTSGQIVNLYDQLLKMINRITSLEEQLAKGKGELEVFIINKGTKTKVFNGNVLTFNLNMEDYMTQTKIGLSTSPVSNGNRCYKNDLYINEDFVLEIRNNAKESPLGLLANRNYAQISGALPSSFTWTSAPVSTIKGDGAQALWTDKTSKALFKDYNTELPAGTDANGPQRSTQINNQWLWLQNKDVNGNFIYRDFRQEVGTTIGLLTNNGNISGWEIPRDYTTVPANSISEVARTVIDTTRNLGFITNLQYSSVSFPIPRPANVSSILSPTASAINYDITAIKNWSWMVPNTNRYNTTDNESNFATAIIPSISNFNDITDNSSQQLKIVNVGDSNVIQIPIKIYFRPYTGTIVKSPSGAGLTEFIDNATVGLGGDMPVCTSFSPGNTQNKLVISVATDITASISPGDKIVLTGITDSTYSVINGKPLTVISSVYTTTTQIILNYPATGIPTGTATITQVHLYTTASSNFSNQYKQYTVYGNLVGQDGPLVKNYIEFYNPSISPTPVVHNKKLRYYLETETSARPIEFQFNWNMTHFKRVSVVNASTVAQIINF